MIRPRLLIALIFATVCTIANAFGQAPCKVCRARLDANWNVIEVYCGNPDNNSWGSENCRVVHGDSFSCTSPPPNCYYWEPEPPSQEEIQNCNEQTGCGSPIIVDIAGDGYELTDPRRGVLFDINDDGTADQIGWTVAGGDDTFLWLDGNGNGVVDGGTELFGDAVYDNGFEKLRMFDRNADGVVDASDPVWDSLRLWLDSNHNGVSEPAEISTVVSSPIRGIGVPYKIVGRRDRFGNLYRYKGRVYMADDDNGFDRVYDIIFAKAP